MRAISVPWKKQGQEQVRGEGSAAEAGKAGEYGPCLFGGIVGSRAQLRTIERLILSKILKTWNQRRFSEVECVAQLVKGISKGEVKNENVSRELQCT